MHRVLDPVEEDSDAYVYSYHGDEGSRYTLFTIEVGSSGDPYIVRSYYGYNPQFCFVFLAITLLFLVDATRKQRLVEFSKLLESEGE